LTAAYDLSRNMQVQVRWNNVLGQRGHGQSDQAQGEAGGGHGGPAYMRHDGLTKAFEPAVL
ncbi:hypothetical protein OMF49_03480, partial [Bordetella pertussis]